jgi:hypothetical protein
MLDTISNDELTASLLSLAESGKVLAKCPNCGMIMAAKEVSAEKCDCCGEGAPIETILWSSTEYLPKS